MAAGKFKLDRLFQPGTIGGMTVPNRIVMPPMVTEYAAPGGYITPTITNYYAERAKGGTGLVIVEAACVDPRGRAFNRQIAIYNDEFLPGLRELAGAIKASGARAAIQIHHAGMSTGPKVTGSAPLGPSAIAMRGYSPAQEMSAEDIRSAVQSFAGAALRVKQAGFEGVEIHAAHMYLLAQFLSPAWNLRRDSYGGSVENRARMLVETIWAIREVVGGNYPVWCRINGEEYGQEGQGVTLEEAKLVSRLAEDAGSDAISVSCFGWGHYGQANMPASPGALLPLSHAIKGVVSVPVMAVGRLDPRLGEVALKDGRADYIAIGRALITDAYLPVKATRGELEDVTPCISCYRCLPFDGDQSGMKCSTNAALGHEDTHPSPAPQPLKVLVVGGGPAGMEAARVAAMRGHRVTLVERNPDLGGQLALACRHRYQNRYPTLLSYLRKQLSRLGVQVELGQEATPETVSRLQPDAVVVATGAGPLIPHIPGVTGRAATAYDVLAGRATVGGRAVVIGGGRVGLRTAQFLAEHGKKVTLLEQGGRLGQRFTGLVRRPLLDLLTDLGVELVTGAKAEEITEVGVMAAVGQARQVFEADTVVLASGAAPNAVLFHALEGKVPRIFRIGDSQERGNILQAIAAGYQTGMEL
jgi:2,4-dienoyl-CoA reductase-like NADH-dependent reductase (Old Yellow Enzyme family)/thioredoxin reductase